MSAPEKCHALTRSGAPCRSRATALSASTGPVCPRHLGLLVRRRDGVPDRTVVLAARFTADEASRLRQVADLRAMTVSDLLHHLALDVPLPEAVPSRAEAVFHRDLRSLGRLVNQVAASLNKAAKGGGLTAAAESAAGEAVRLNQDIHAAVQACVRELVAIRRSRP